MKQYSANQIRNISILGHGGEGKTTLVETMLFNAGATDRIGKVEEGNTVTDFDPEEAKRQFSIQAALAPLEWKGNKINLIDAPGYFDFFGEVIAAAAFADAALILVGASSGPAVGTEKAMDLCKKQKLPRMIVVNQLDREHADFIKVAEQLKEKYGTGMVPFQLPMMDEQAFLGYVDLVTMTGKLFDGKALKDAPVPAALENTARELHDALIEAASESDEELLEKYFGGEPLTPEEIVRGLAEGTAAGSVTLVGCCSAAQNLGVYALMDHLAAYMPSAAAAQLKTCKNLKTGAQETCKTDPSAPFAAQVIKTLADPFVGKISLFKIYSGTLSKDVAPYNANVEKSEKPGTIYIMRGKKLTEVDKLSAGDIGAMAKLQYTLTGHTLCDGTHVRFDEIQFPIPGITLAITAKKEGDEDKVFAGFNRLREEDPIMSLEKNAVTGDMLIGGLGEMHLEVLCQKVKNKFNVEAQLADPKIPYRESIRKTVKAQGRHKKQSGGHGQFGDCWIEFAPLYEEGKEFEFIDKIVGGVVPRQFIPAVEKGLREAVVRGVLAGYPMVNLSCTLYDGSFHAVDSSEMAFKTAARIAYKKGCLAADPMLLEPIYRYEVLVPDEYMGDIIGDMNRRRGRIMGMNPVESGQEVIAEAPLAEMFKYATDLRSMTQGRGSFRSEFVRYEEVPGNIAQKVIAQAKKDEEEED